MRLYFIGHDDEGESLDLFVWANTPDEAATIWREHYDLGTRPQPQRMCMWAVPLTPPLQACAVPWSGLLLAT